MFEDEVANELQAYVYRLVDPRNGETFYVGKGRGNRIFHHAKEASLPTREADIMSLKLDKIREIKRAGLEVECVIHRHGMDDSTAYQVEAALIDAYPRLHNAVRGHHASVWGIATVNEINQRYNLPEVTSFGNHKILAITINKLQGRRDPRIIYDLVSYCWPISIARAKNVELVLALDRGVIVGAYTPTRWGPAIAADFPEAVGRSDEPGRIAFDGHRADEEIWSAFVGPHGKRVCRAILPPAQQACRYINC